MNSIEYLRKHRRYLNISRIANDIRIDRNFLYKIVCEKQDAAGRPVLLPLKFNEPLDGVVNELKGLEG